MNNICAVCKATNSNRWYKMHTLCSACYFKEYSQKNKVKIAVYKKQWAQENKEKTRSAVRKYEASPKGIATANKRKSTLLYKQQALFRANEYVKNNKEHYKIIQRNYQAKRKRYGGKIKDNEKLLEVYKNCPKEYEVDHIIPLINKNICGLHVSWNMQYLTRSENAKKSNSFDFTYDNKGWLNPHV